MAATMSRTPKSTPPQSAAIARVLERLPDAKSTGDSWQARCPAHEDHRASLSLAVGKNGGAVVHCHAGCTPDAIVSALGLTLRDLMPTKTTATKKEIVAIYRYTDAEGVHQFDVVRFSPKDFRQRRADGTWSMKGVQRVPYRLADLAGVVSAFIPEGEQDVDALAALGLPATCNPGGAGKWTAGYSATLKANGITRVCILPDNDEPGRAHAEDVARHCHEAGVEAHILALPGLPAKGDVSDWLRAGGTRDQLLQMAKLAPQWTSQSSPSAVCSEPVVSGVTTSQKPKTKRPSQGRDVSFDDVDPWPDEVAGTILLDTLVATFRRYLALPDHAAAALALWTLHAVAFDAWFASPILAVTSPAPRCGKTLVLIVLGALVPRRLFAANVTPAVLFRTIEKYGPTLLIDEADTFIKDNDELRGVLNSGHTRTTAIVIRAVGDDHDPRAFSTWCAKAIAMIGKLPATLHDRAIEIRMRRRLPGERVERLRQDRIEAECDPLRRQMARWCEDHAATLAAADPAMPTSLHDRAADCWRPLLAIADAAGGDWPRQARDAAQALSGAEAEDDTATMLLRDIQTVFAEAGDPDAMGSTALAEALVSMEDRPWAEWSQGRKLTSAKLTRMLTRHDVHAAGNIRIGPKVAKGYRRVAFQEAWDRYLPAEIPLQRNNPNESGPEPRKANRYTPEPRSGSETVTTARATDESSGVAVFPLPDGHGKESGDADGDRI
jgi:hypothetical protein